MPANTADFFGEGTYRDPQGSKPYDPNDEPNPANPGGISNNELARRRLGYEYGRQQSQDLARVYDRNASQSSSFAQQDQAYRSGNIGGVTGAYNMQNPEAQAQWQREHALPGQYLPPGSLPPGAGGGTPGNDVMQPAKLDPNTYIRNATQPARTDSVDDQIRGFLAQEQARQGQPSEAEALMLKGRDQLFGQSMGLAAGARGGAAARERAEREARAGNVALGARVTQDVAALRAREEAERRDRVGRILDLLSSNAGRGDVTQLGYGQLGAQLYGTDVGAQTSRYGTDVTADTARDVAGTQAETSRYVADTAAAATRYAAKKAEPDMWDRIFGLAGSAASFFK